MPLEIYIRTSSPIEHTWVMPCSKSRRPCPFRDVWLNSFIHYQISTKKNWTWTGIQRLEVRGSNPGSGSNFFSRNMIILLYVHGTNCHFHHFSSSTPLFSSQNLLCIKFLKSYVLLPTVFTSVICPSMALWRRQFLFRICSIQLAFLPRISFRSLPLSPMCSRTSSLVTFSCVQVSEPYIAVFKI